MAWLAFVALALVAAVLLWFWWSPRWQQYETGTAHEESHDCGALPRDFRYPGATELAVRIVRQCDREHKVRISTPGTQPNTWVPLRVGSNNLFLDESAAYIIPGNRFRLECPGNEGECAVTVLTMNHGQQPDTNRLLSAPATVNSQPAGRVIECDAWSSGNDILANLTRHPFTVEVRWIESCSDAAPRVRFKRLDRAATAADLYRPNSAGEEAQRNANNEYVIEREIRQNESLEVKCPEGSGERCRFTVVWSGQV
jgi:hypothetical protein